MACPFFVPLTILNDGSWPHPSRLPLGAGWTGNCRASGEELPASDEHAREFCNLGYATNCPHLPQHRDWDAVRFSVARASENQITIHFVCELDHAPIEHGKLTFDLVSERGETDAAELMREYGANEKPIAQTAWNNRLASLTSLGLLVESSQGRAKRYRPLFRER